MLRTWIIPSGSTTKKLHYSESFKKLQREKMKTLKRYILNSIKSEKIPTEFLRRIQKDKLRKGTMAAST
jgi:protein associated with RNAse G/E